MNATLAPDTKATIPHSRSWRSRAHHFMLLVLANVAAAMSVMWLWSSILRNEAAMEQPVFGVAVAVCTSIAAICILIGASLRIGMGLTTSHDAKALSGSAP